MSNARSITAAALLALIPGCKGPGLSNIALPWHRPAPARYDPDTQPIMEARRARDPDGKVVRKWWVLSLPDNSAVLHGPDVSWYGDGTLRAVQHWERGLRHGRFARWYRDGVQEREQGYAMGVEVGTWTTWYRDGTKRSELTMSGAGPGRFWHESGELAAEGWMRDGDRRGTWIFWRPDGTVCEEQVFGGGSDEPPAVRPADDPAGAPPTH